MKSRRNSLINYCVFILSCVFVLQANALRAQPATTPNYQQTILNLESKLQDSALGPLDYYNLGTAYAKLDSFGQARLYLEKAQLLAPWNKKVEQNVRWVKTELADEVAILPQLFISRIWNKLSLTASPLTWQILGIAFLLIASALMYYRLFRMPREVKNYYWLWIAGIFLCSAICFGFSANGSGQLYGEKRWVVTEDSSGLKEAPEKSALLVAPLYKGVIAEPLDKVGEWWKIRLEDGAEGWIPMKYLKNISFNPTK